MCVACSVAQSHPTLCDPMDCGSPDSSIHGIFQARILGWDGVGCQFLLQGIFPTQVLNPYLFPLLHWQVDSLPLSLLGSLNNSLSLSLSYYFKELNLMIVDAWQVQNSVR